MSPTGNVPLHHPACRWTAIFPSSFMPEPVYPVTPLPRIAALERLSFVRKVEVSFGRVLV